MKYFRNILAIILLAFLLASNHRVLVDARNSFGHELAGAQQAVRSYNGRTVMWADSSSLTAEEKAAIGQVSAGVVSVYGITQVRETANAASAGTSFLGNLGMLLPIFDEAPKIKMSSGTGFFIDSDGYILTNNHVVADEDAEYSVQLTDGKKKKASVTYRDPKNDLALLKIDGKGYATVKLGDSSQLKVGTKIFGLGNAFGKFDNTISRGKVAALKKAIVAGNEEMNQKLTGVIQTTAQLYPGDSGGPLFDSEGRVVGINVAVATDRPNMSFSIPIERAKSIINAVAMY